MLGKLLEKSRSLGWNGAIAASIKSEYDITQAAKNVNPNGLPHAPQNPYKKRPIKLTYEKTEYHSFRLPSEQHFLLSSFDTEDLFGKRRGIEHSPHIRSQLDLDSNLVWLYFLFTAFAFFSEFSKDEEVITLRENMFNSEMGRFSIEDFK